MFSKRMVISRDNTRPFKSAQKTFDKIDGSIVGALIASASDLALLIDKKGMIKDVSIGNQDLDGPEIMEWVGKPWIETVAIDSRDKVKEVLQEAAANLEPRWRHINQTSSSGLQIPIGYRAINVSADGKIVAMGRDLRTIAAAQQRLVEAQQSMEREYLRFRLAETRYRFLFQSSAEAIVIVDRDTLKVVEINPSAAALLGDAGKRMQGRPFIEGLANKSIEQGQALLSKASNLGQAEAVRIKLADGTTEVNMVASLFRQDTTAHLLVRFSPVETSNLLIPKAKSNLLKVLEAAPEGFVVTSLDGRILTANQTFLEFAELATEEQARGELLDRFLGRPGVDFKVLIANVNEHGSVRLFATSMRGEFGTQMDVEISGVAVPDGDPPCLGFIVHNIAGRVSVAQNATNEFPRSVTQMRELVGRAPLKEIVRETTDVIERLCIEAALQLTGDNRASAAEMLGLSRQGLYDKLRRHGLGDLGSYSN